MSLNPAVDIGQIEGGFVMGLGYLLQEEVVYDATTAELATVGTWEYKPPMVCDIPSVFNVTLMKDMYNKSGILGSKATGEPAYVLANSIFFAVKMAIESARRNIYPTSTASTRQTPAYLNLPAPLTVSTRQQACFAEPGNPMLSRYVLPN